ncbi:MULTISPECIES: M56 family metallopeptidase [unclassified Streptomyces]|uniref:M56 family metallopeptidase n=1 Tax=unclassified Streptomyces TaxID=2593676 RepID=UPI00382B7E09|nr:M56 family metallopeptidase [Streptomyces sp. NBC_01176]
MRINVYLPLFLPLLLTAAAAQVGRRISPAPAARVLTVAAVLTAAASTWALLLLAATLVNEAPLVATETGETGRRLPEPVPVAIAVAAITLLWLIAFRLVRALRAHWATRRVLERLCEGHPPDSELVVAASSTPRAFAIPGTPGRILVTSAMLGALEPAERRVLLAHERAHLTHRHSMLSTAVTLAAAANPVLGPVRTTVAFLVERWADEEAARSVGDRRTTARALARAALVAQRARPSCALNFSEHAVTRRIAALQTTPPPNLWSIGVAVLALAALSAFGALDATGDLLRLLGESLAY